MATITLFNKGRRPWDLIDAEGNKKRVEPDESIELDEVKALRMLKDYPRDWVEGGRQKGRSASELSRWEQSLKDREKNLDERERAIEEREKATADAEPNSEPKKRGRPTKLESEGSDK